MLWGLLSMVVLTPSTKSTRDLASLYVSFHPARNLGTCLNSSWWVHAIRACCPKLITYDLRIKQVSADEVRKGKKRC
ncbi:hypothetical protein EV127DRAFT_430345 [Xylaria flabelliformis]|nr:hypothetical protein EV127DRAFT_430345 [Xylaria flabelliformis]